MIYLLDTNILAALEQHDAGAAAQMLRRVETVRGNRIAVSVVVACEIQFGLRKKGSLKLAARMKRILGRLEILPLEETAIDAYAELRVDLEKRGLPISANDMLIAAHALALGAVLVTDNTREFKRVKGLTVENWLRP